MLYYKANEDLSCTPMPSRRDPFVPIAGCCWQQFSIMGWWLAGCEITLPDASKVGYLYLWDERNGKLFIDGVCSQNQINQPGTITHC
jgi:hypothetical protein